LLTMFDPRNKLTHEVVKEMREYFPVKLFDTRTPRNVKLSESPRFGKPIILYDPESKGCQPYLDLAKDLLQRNGLSTEGFDRPLVTPESEVQTATETEAAIVEATTPTEDVSVEHIEVAAESQNVTAPLQEESTLLIEEVSGELEADGSAVPAVEA